MTQFLSRDLRTGNPIQSTVIISASEYSAIIRETTEAEVENWYKFERRFSLNCGKIIILNDLDKDKDPSLKREDKEIDFDFTEDTYKFKYIDHKTKRSYCDFELPTLENPDIKDFVFDMINFDKSAYSKALFGKDPFTEYKSELVGLNSKLIKIENSKPSSAEGKELKVIMLREGKELREKLKTTLASMEEDLESHMEGACDLLMKFVFILMYHFVKERPQEVGGETRDRYIKDTGIKTSYKYNGKINVLDNRVYKLTTTVAEKKEYMRHIGRWVVRGHWRTYEDGKIIWINEYLKGDGKVENREYVFENKQLKTA